MGRHSCARGLEAVELLSSPPCAAHPAFHAAEFQGSSELLLQTTKGALPAMRSGTHPFVDGSPVSAVTTANLARGMRAGLCVFWSHSNAIPAARRAPGMWPAGQEPVAQVPRDPSPLLPLSLQSFPPNASQSPLCCYMLVQPLHSAGTLRSASQSEVILLPSRKNLRSGCHNTSFLARLVMLG